MVLSGGCHCGAIAVRFTPSRPLEELALRACQCSFCLRHGANTTTDAAGHLAIDVRDATRLQRYRFGLATAEYLVCGACGVYVAAVLTDGDRAWSTLNVRVLELPDGARFAAVATAVSYDGEDVAARIARRKAVWTPTVVVEAASAAR
jgi:hypothetical protein